MAEKLNEKEVEKLVIDLAKQGKTAEKIGLILKKEHKIVHGKNYEKKISKILKENNLYINPDIKNIAENLEKLKKHISKNKGDKICRRALMIKDAKLRKLISLKK